MKRGKLKEYYNKLNNFFLADDSKEYQRTLAGISIYFNMMKQRSFMNFLFLTIFMFFFIFFVVVFANIQKGVESLTTVVYNSMSFATFFIIFMLLLFLFFIYWNHDFKIIKGMKIYFRNPFSFLIILFIILMILVSFFQSQSSLNEIITSILTSSILLLMVLLVLSSSFLKPESLLNYASEKLSNTSLNTKNKRFNKSNYYIQYYYAILTYYKKVTRRYRATYKDDILIRTKSQLIPLLCSQGLICNLENKKELIDNLEGLSKINPDIDPDKFTNKMIQIEKNVLKGYTNEEEKKKIFDILKDKTGKEKIREYLFYLITIISIISAIVNTFFREAVINLLAELF